MCWRIIPGAIPSERELSVYLPHGYADSESPYLTLWDLAAYTNSGPGHLNWRNHGEVLPERLDRLIGQGLMEPAVVAFPDCYTSLGGNQYVNSPSVGRYADYLNEELVPFLSEQLNVVDSRDGRAVFGKSSGGYGALVLAMNYPETWGAAASHAGDVGFEMVYRKDFPVACDLLSAFKGDFEAFIRAFWRKNRPSGRDYTTMMVLAMAASYDPDPANPSRIRLPFDLRTCELNPERWQHWLECDPLLMLEQCAGRSSLCMDFTSMWGFTTSIISSTERAVLSINWRNAALRITTRNSRERTHPSTGAWTTLCLTWPTP